VRPSASPHGFRRRAAAPGGVLGSPFATSKGVACVLVRNGGASAGEPHGPPDGRTSLPPMIVERSMHPDWLSNTYLVAAGPQGDALLVDAGGPMDAIFAKADEHGLTVTHVLLTHHHHDHVAELGAVKERWPEAEVLIHPDERDQVAGATGDLEPDADLAVAGLQVRTLHTPGHTKGMLALLIDGTDVFTGDTLFKNSVGGVRAPGSTGYDDLKHSVMDVLLKLPPETTIRPGHTDPTTVADELETNRFVRIWRGLDPEGDEPCTALGEPATLVLWGDDYDGGHKAWVRWEDGTDDIVPGSRVSR
jgi:hydroxyacylglutathione hydrolase